MKIPLKIPQREFYNSLPPGSKVKITSRYKGVFFLHNKRQSPVWVVQLNAGKKTQHIGSFPFTHEGEAQAGKAYIKARKEWEAIHGPIRPYTKARKTG